MTNDTELREQKCFRAKTEHRQLTRSPWGCKTKEDPPNRIRAGDLAVDNQTITAARSTN